MSTRYNDGSHYENHPQAAELRDGAAHAHLVAEQQGKQDHLTGQEHTRQALEHSHASPHQAPTEATVGHGVAAFGHAEIAALAHALWEARGCPEGSPDDDWFRAAEQLRSRAHTR
jgi:alpha-D-ribose 1-methylphosphonate 5-triphosphate synthase subunit PhnI